MEILAECKSCKEKFTVGKGNLVSREPHTIGHDKIYLTYYECPKCRVRHYVQVDNNETLGMLKQLELLSIRLNVNKKQGKGLPRKQSVRFKRLRNDLKKQRRILMDRYNGKVINHALKERLEFLE